MTRADVLDEFTRWSGYPSEPRELHTQWYSTDDMADEIVQLREQLAAVEAERDFEAKLHQHTQQKHAHALRERDRAKRILAALREPSEAVVNALRKHIGIYSLTTAAEFTDAFTAAVAAAEREVNNDN